jgi:hypothetical protein
MVGGDTDGGVARYMVVGKRGGRENFGAERGGKLEKAGWLACGLLGSGLGFRNQNGHFRVSVRVSFCSFESFLVFSFFFKKK